MECSVGVLMQKDCHKHTYGKVTKDVTNLGNLSETNQTLLKLRLGTEDLKTVCIYHEKKFLAKYNHLFAQVCCDPLNYHTGLKKTRSKGCREIKLEHLKKDRNYQVDLVPGKSLCPTCYKNIFSSIEEKTGGHGLTKDELYVPAEVSLREVDEVCSVLDMSPVSKIKRLSVIKQSSALVSKTENITNVLRRKLEHSFAESMEVDNEQETNTLCNEYNILIDKLKEKCKIASNEKKVKIISLMPSNWSKSKICEELQVSEYLVRVTRELVKTDGILPDLAERKAGKQLDEAVMLSISEFYQGDDNSRICPGKKDCVSVKINGSKEHKQKRLILCNLKELYVHFKSTYPDLKVGLSKFCVLRPKWCVLAGSSGTHTVCVCVYHQNVKLMLEGGNVNVDYKDLLEIMTCGIDRYDCMMGMCPYCPGVQLISDFLTEEMEEMSEEICYKQWVSTDRANLLTVVQPSSEFIESLTEKLVALKKHHFVSKTQSQFLKTTKENLTENECIVLADFAENYSFVIQDEIQSFHWVSTQATLHPFVYYFKSDGVLKSHSMCVISDHLEHNTVALHTFQKYLTSHLKESLPSVKKVLYFSDGAASQYKNRKNFINICYHKSDFGLDAEWHFFASAHGKNACDGVGGTTKREATKASLQRAYKNQILTPKDLYDFAVKNLKGISYMFISTEEVKTNEEMLIPRFEKCKPVPQTREKHRFLPLSKSTIRCYRTSASFEYEDLPVAMTQSGFNCCEFKCGDYIACIYDEQWWLAVIEKIDCENEELYVKFFKPPGPRTSFQKTTEASWVPLSRVMRKLTPLELTTPTGRSHQITDKLCNEISQLYNDYSQ